MNRPFITYVTRTCKRPLSLKRAILSTYKQTDKDFSHLFLVDNSGNHQEGNICWANQQFYKHKDIVDGEYVFILDDSCVIIDKKMVSAVKNIANEHNYPDIILSRSIAPAPKGGYHKLPLFDIWGDDWEGIPSSGTWGGNEQCYVVKRHVWQDLIHEFSVPRGGDYYFGQSLVDSGLFIVKTSRIFGKSVFRGRGLTFEDCKKNWFEVIAKEFNIKKMYDDVWMRWGKDENTHNGSV